MRLPLLDKDDQTSFDTETFNKLVDTFLEKGFTYFDTAYTYHGYWAEEAVRESLVKRHNRDEFELATKLPMRDFQSAEDMERIFNEHFSRKGNNYVGGSIVNLPIGNTEVIAKKIQELTRSDIFQIKTVKSYPEDYTETTNVAQEEKRENARPELTEIVDDMDSYDVIYIGYPNWWGTIPMAIFTFLESYDFSGKTIIPFCTHEGSGMGSGERDIKKLCPNARVLSGLAIRGGNVNRADKDVANWLKKFDLIP